METANNSNNNFNINKSISTSKFHLLANNTDNFIYKSIDSPEIIKKDSNLNKNESIINHAFLPTLDDIINENENKNIFTDRISKVDSASYIRSVDKSYEPNSLMSHNQQKFPTDMSSTSQKFFSVSKNMSKYFKLILSTISYF